MKKHRSVSIFELLGLVVLAALTLAACRGGENAAAPAPAAEKIAAPAVEEPTLEALYGMLGKGEAENSGIVPSSWSVTGPGWT